MAFSLIVSGAYAPPLGGQLSNRDGWELLLRLLELLLHFLEQVPLRCDQCA